VLRSLKPDEVHLEVLNVALNHFPCEGQKQDRVRTGQVRTTQACSSIARVILDRIIPSKHQKENKNYKTAILDWKKCFQTQLFYSLATG